MATNKTTVSEIVNIVLKALGVAMPVAVIVMSVLKVSTPENSIMLLAIGVFALGLVSLSKE